MINKIFKIFYQNDLLKNRKIIMDNYYAFYNRKLNFKKIDSFSAFIQRSKIQKRNEKLWPLVDKYAVREHITRLIGKKYLVKLLGAWDKETEIDYNSLPSKFVLKTNHGSSWNIIVPDKGKLNEEDSNALLKKWLSSNFYDLTLEPHYRRIVPKILAEEYLIDSNDELIDYKFFCFNGQPYFLQLDMGRYTPFHSRIYLSLEWKRLPFMIGFPENARNPIKPDNFDEMLRIVKVLAQKHRHVRVDLYNIDGRIVFGELTFTHGSGFSKFYFNNIYDFIIGDILNKRINYEKFREMSRSLFPELKKINN